MNSPATALVADSRPGTTPYVLRQHGLLDLFETLAISEVVGVEKPDARMFRAALDALVRVVADLAPPSARPGHCPACGAPVSVVLDLSVPDQSYVEDCEVCCQPMLITIDATAEDPIVDVTRDNE